MISEVKFAKNIIQIHFKKKVYDCKLINVEAHLAINIINRLQI